MTSKTVFQQIYKILNGEGDPCDFGCPEQDIEKMIQYVKKESPFYPYSVVSGWVWIDIETNPPSTEECGKEENQPCVIYAKKIIKDERNRPFDGVHTTELREFHKNCIFITQNTAYILSGPGVRLSVDVKTIDAIYRLAGATSP